MDQTQFCYWLQGFAEINDAPPTEAQWKVIRNMLNTVLEPKYHNKPTYRDATSVRNPAPDNNWTTRAFLNQKPKVEPDAYL